LEKQKKKKKSKIARVRARIEKNRPPPSQKRFPIFEVRQKATLGQGHKIFTISQNLLLPATSDSQEFPQGSHKSKPLPALAPEMVSTAGNPRR
jgi:hypothetical protein